MTWYQPEACDAFVPTPHSTWGSCAYCCQPKRSHRFIEATVWSSAGPFLMPATGLARVPNPDFGRAA